MRATSLTITILLLAALSSATMVRAAPRAFSPATDLIINNDRFKAETSIRAGLGIARGAISADCERPALIYLATISDDKSKPPHAALVMAGFCKDWRYLKCHSMAALADGKRVDLGDGSHNGDVGNGGVSEQVAAMLSAEQLETFASASRVDFQLCNTEWIWTAAELDLTRAFRDRFNRVLVEKGYQPDAIVVSSKSVAICSSELIAKMFGAGVTPEQVRKICAAPETDPAP